MLSEIIVIKSPIINTVKPNKNEGFLRCLLSSMNFKYFSCDMVYHILMTIGTKNLP